MKAAVTLLLLLLPATTAGARSLSWSAFEVRARLDADGRLHVRERQQMVFDGDWNGGERVFRVEPGQRLRLERIVRIDPPTGREVELERGNLDRVDEWDWTSRHHLRWRSRLPSDPSFTDETLVYRIDYTLAGVVRETADGYRLEHDFAFPDRAFPIRGYSLELELDPAWVAPADLPRRLERDELRPGEGVVVGATLQHRGTQRPAAAIRPVPDHKVQALFLAVAALVGLKLTGLWRAETARGRRDRPAVPRPISREWLDEHLFSLRPEEAGALWDRKVGAPEVAALIARLVAEGKLASRVADEGGWLRRPTMELELRVGRGDLTGYERKLIDKLFFGGRTTTDTRALREHYRQSGFDPAAAIRPGLERRLERLVGGGEKPAKPPWKPTALLLAAWVAAVALEAATRGPGALGPLIAAFAILTPVPVLWAYIAAVAYRGGLGRPPRAWLAFLVPLAALAGGCFVVAWLGSGGRRVLPDLEPGLWGVISLALLPLLVAVSVLNQAHTRERRAVVARRQLLAAARHHLARQLDRAEPDLEDGWFPYLLAFGLSRRADAWSRRFAGDAAATTGTATRSWSGSSGSGWSGGGGAFGGAGATVAWTAAATGMASGVSPPSSSGSSGGGGGGSSGGGGGGGW